MNIHVNIPLRALDRVTAAEYHSKNNGNARTSETKQYAISTSTQTRDNLSTFKSDCDAWTSPPIIIAGMRVLKPLRLANIE